MSGDSSPVTARELLFDRSTGDGAADALVQRLTEQDVDVTAHLGLQHLTATGRKAVDEEIARVATDLMDIDLGDALVAGWRRYSVLRASAVRTMNAPGSEEVISMASHRITSAYRPRVDLFVDGVRVNSFEFELELVVDVVALAAVIRTGHLVALRGGSCRLALSLKLEGLLLVERRHSFDPQRVVRLRTPLSLLGTREASVPSQRRGAEGERLTGSSGWSPRGTVGE